MTAPRTQGTPIRSANDPPPGSTDSSEELDPNLNPNDSTGRTDEEEPPVVEDPEVARLKRYTGILEANLRDQNATIQAMAERGDRAAAPPAPPAPRDVQTERTEFYNDPLEATRRVIRDELKETVAPLLDFVQGLKGQGAKDKFISAVKQDARFSGMWDAAVERAVEETLARVPADQINEQVVRSAAVQAIGLKAMGALEGAEAPPAPPAPPAPSGERRVTTPPHMRPSAPPAPTGRNGEAPKRRPLTENEERLRRENKQTVEDFWFWMELPANEVTTAVPPSQRGKK